MDQPTQRWVARALRAGGPEGIEVGVEELPPLRRGEALVRVEAAGLNHAETLIRSGKYTVRLPFPYPLGGEGSGVVIATGAGAPISVGTRVCWAAVIGSCATFVTAPASMLVPIPEGLKVVSDKNIVTISGINKELVGNFTSSVRALKKPEPYKGKGIHYDGGVIRRKQGKKAA